MERINALAQTALPAAVLASHAAPTVSDRYVHLSTADIIQHMAAEGWEVASARAAQPRVRDPLFARHRVDFRRPGATKVGGIEPRIILINSHDGTSSARALAGYYRFVCSNGLVIGRTEAAATQRHVTAQAAQFVGDIQRMADVMAAAGDAYRRWMDKQLTAAQRTEYARLAGLLRFRDADAFTPATLLERRRAEDDDGTLFAAFNAIQENTTKGGMRGINAAGRRMLSQPLSGIDSDATYNARLWQLTEEYAEAIA